MVMVMSYYNPRKWISPDDQLIPDVENKLITDKRAYSVQSGTGKSFKPPSSIELTVVIKETKETLRLIEWEDRQGKLSIELTSIDNIFRKGHFNQDWHHNPNGNNIRPPHHIHFPTEKYPKLDRKPTYAYPVESENDYLNALSKFCNDTNIELRYASIPLLRR
ncbi:MAG: hypothetical protein MUO17_06620 [Dehalococcoidales bacterium]|nr:hypothetical protein [Dehalococcoidales bacterium]